MLFSTVFQSYHGGQCTYACTRVPGISSAVLPYIAISPRQHLGNCFTQSIGEKQMKQRFET